MKLNFTLIALLISTILIGQNLEPGIDGTILDLTPPDVTIVSYGYTHQESSNCIANVNGKILFVAEDVTNGAELWISDGTAAGTTLLKDIYPGSESSSPYGLVEAGDNVIFAAISEASGAELWVTDGTTEGTVQIKDIYPGEIGSEPQMMVSYVDDKVLFRAYDVQSKLQRDEQWLWISDGTADGTMRIGDIQPSAEYGDSGLKMITVTEGGKAFFVGSDPVYGNELYVTQGTAETTRLTLDIGFGASEDPEAPEGATVDTRIEHVIAINEEQVSFRAETPKYWLDGENLVNSLAYEMWISDGTAKGTYFIGDYAALEDPTIPGNTGNNGYALLGNYDGNLYIRAGDGLHLQANGSGSINLARTDAIPEHADPDKGITFYDGMNWNFQEPPVYKQSWVSDFFVFDGLGYFKGLNQFGLSAYGSVGHELFYTDGQLTDTNDVGEVISGVHLAEDITVGSKHGYPKNFMVCNQRMYFVANDDAVSTNRELWMVKKREDAGGVIDAVKVFDAADNSNPQSLVNVDGNLYFIAGLYDDAAGTNDRRLYLYDDGQTKVEDVKDPKAAGPAVTDYKNPYVSFTIESLEVKGQGDTTIIDTTAGTLQMIAEVYPIESDDPSVVWSVETGTGSATISTEGLLTAVTDGTVTVTATSVAIGTIANSLEVTISNQVIVIVIDSVEVKTESGAAIIDKKAGTLQMIAEIYPEENDTTGVNWTVTDVTGKATISTEGLLTAVDNGTVTVTATSVIADTVFGSLDITISNQEDVIVIDSVKVSGEDGANSIEEKAGTLQMIAEIYPEESATTGVTWSVTLGTGDATIDTDGLLTAIADGAVTVLATSAFDNAIAGTMEITISNQEDEVGISDNFAEVKIYPNPAKSVVNVEFNGGEEAELQIFNVLGKAVVTKMVSSNQTIDVSMLNTGVYIIKVNAIDSRFVDYLFIE